MNFRTSFCRAGAAAFFRAASRLLACCLLAGQVQAAIHYVKFDASGIGNGTSWADAFNALHDAIAAASPGDEIWVAAGTYLPTVTYNGGTDRYKTFYINKDIELYGGFNGTETLLSQRNWATNVTTLSGDIGTPGSNSDNAYHILWIDHVSTAMRLDGFTITLGNGNGNQPPDFFGGGIYNDGMHSNSGSNPTIANCFFTGNSAGAGGGMHNRGGGGVASPVLINCVFYFDGGMNNHPEIYGTTSPVLTNCTFYGSGIYNSGYVSTSSPVFINCILWGSNLPIQGDGNANPVFISSIVQNGMIGTNNLDLDPLFVNAAGGDLRLQAASPARDAGSNDALPPGVVADLDGNPRIVDATGKCPARVDIGAYEYQTAAGFVTCYQDSDGDGFGNPNASQNFPTACGAGYVCDNTDCNDASNAVNPAAAETCNTFDDDCDGRVDETCCPAGSVVFVKHDAVGNRTGNSWANAIPDLQPAIDLACDCPAVQEIWVAQGTYKPTVPHPDGTPRYKTFFLDCDVKIYGGFNGTENSLSQRDWATHLTILSGDLGEAGNSADNAYHVGWIVHAGDAMTLDGFTITAGRANGGYYFPEPNSPTGHRISIKGSGIYLCGSHSTIANCNFKNNGGSDTDGGGVYNMWSVITGAGYPKFTNCLFFANSAGLGGGMFNYSCGPVLTNCTFSGNSRGAIYNSNGVSVQLTNCIVWQNWVPVSEHALVAVDGGTYTVNYSLVQDGFAGTGNLNLDPLFVNQPGGDLRLQSGSPAINSGSNAAVPPGVTTDLDGNPRIVGGTVDMGAYEYQGIPVTCFADSDGDGFGDPGVSQEFNISCGAGFVSDNTDCDDSDDAVNPAATEICNGVDDDCDGSIPANEADADDDGFRICEGDCDDDNDAVNPGAAEICNGMDDDCDGSIPANEADADDDGFRICGGDCDDDDDAVNPDATEICNGTDDDCDGLTDEGDADGDGIADCTPDNCLTIANPGQEDLDVDGIGDACDGTVSICDAIEALIAAIEASGIPNGLENALVSKLENAMSSYENGNYNAAIGQLDAFINLVQAQSGNGIPTEFAEEWIAIAEALVDAIENENTNCTNPQSIVAPPGGGNAFEVETLAVLEVFPNPASQEVTVRMHGLNGRAGTLSIFDLPGRLVWRQELAEGQNGLRIELTGSDFGSGAYLVNFQSEGAWAAAMLLIARW